MSKHATSGTSGAGTRGRTAGPATPTAAGRPSRRRRAVAAGSHPASASATRMLLLATVVGLSGSAIGLLLGLPTEHLPATGARLGLVATRLSDAGLRQTLSWCCWAAWAVFSLVGAPLAVGAGRRTARGAAWAPLAPGAGAAPGTNPYRMAAVMRAGVVAPAVGGDTMGAPLVWDERPSDPGGRTGRGSAEARMTTKSTDGGTVLGGDRREPASRLRRDIARGGDSPPDLHAVPSE